MTSAGIEIQLIAMTVAAACALPGAFLVLRRMSLMSDAISHAILPGIVAAFFLTGDLASPLLILAAAATGVLTVLIVELLTRTGLVREDAAIGLTFPLLFSLGVILIARYSENVHLDTDAVLLGELAFAPFDRFVLFGKDLGPRSLFLSGGILLVNLLFLILFFKELKLATFDAALAASLGFSPVVIHYGLMTLVSVTAVGSFEAVGSILVVALMIVPPAAAFLLTDNLKLMIFLSVVIGVVSAVSGYWLAILLDASIAGCMATTAGAAFGLCYLLAPNRGLLALARRRARQRWEFALRMLVVHLLHHEGLPEAMEENRIDHLHEHINWLPEFAKQVTRYGERKGMIRVREGYLDLTEAGRSLAREAVVT
ncbi:MAG: metal ABC transporter permease [Planctomycetota bacterium]|jgi:manganese/zinc/iron transport system permease protein